jgi:hypothetical protein
MVEWFSLRKTVMSRGRQFSGEAEPKLNHGEGRASRGETVTVWSQRRKKRGRGLALRRYARL